MANKLNRILVSILLLVPMASAGDAFAQVWHQERENGVSNVRSESSSPVSLSTNPAESWNAASISGVFEGGAFHRPDRPAGKRELDLSVGELNSFGRFRTAGSLRYRNTRDLARNWNSLIGNDPDNPYVICDTLADNSSTERFDIDGVLSWNISDHWTAGGRIGLTTATLTDSKDPRPRNDISRIPFTLGLEYRFGDGWSAGVFGGVELFFSRFSNHLEYGQKPYRYYKMKGMGDYFAFSSSESSSAPREYEGVTFRAGINLTRAQTAWESFTEAEFITGYENARDGGSAYEWKAGDYRFTRILLRERMDFKGAFRQSLSVRADVKLMDGYWYDQKQRIDTEHGNISYYEVMSRYKNNDNLRLVVGADYGVTRDASWNAALHADFRLEDLTHYADGEPCRQSWTLLAIRADGWKTFSIGRHVLDLAAGAGYVLPLGKALFATGNTAPAKDDITDVYVSPVFDYETSGKVSAFLRADWVFAPVKRLLPGVFVKGSLERGKEAGYYGLTAGAFLKF